MTGGRGGAASKLPGEQCAIVGANIRALRQRRGWTQRKFGELMGWQSASTVCAAEGHRNRRQRSFTTEEVEQLAAIFDVSPSQLMTRCANCGGHPRSGSPAWPAEPHPAVTARPGPLSPTRCSTVMRRRADDHTSRRRDDPGHDHRARHAERRAGPPHAVCPRGSGTGNLALQPHRWHGPPCGGRTCRRDDGPHGRAQVRGNHLLSRVRARHGRERLVRAIRGWREKVTKHTSDAD